MALFLVGLVVGLVAGIAIFFGSLVLREKRCTENPDDIDSLLDEISREEAKERENPLFVEDNSFEEPTESLDPWERPADWWEREDD